MLPPAPQHAPQPLSGHDLDQPVGNQCAAALEDSEAVPVIISSAE